MIAIDDDPGSVRRRRWICWVFVAVGFVVIGGYHLMPVGLAQDAVYQLVGLSSAAAIVIGVRINHPARRRPWFLMAAGQLLWSVADAVFSFDATILGNDRFPSPADPIYLAGYPAVAVGLYFLIRGRRPRRDVAGLLDSAILTTALGLLSWVLLASPTIDNYEDSWLAATVAVAYPIGDIIIIGMVIRLITTPGGRTTSLRLLIAAIVALLAVDTLATASGLLTFDSTGAINFLWLTSYVLWGASALHPSMHDLSQPTRVEDGPFTRKRLIALTIAVLVAPAILAVEVLTNQRLDVWAVVVGSVVMFVLVVVRMNLAINRMATANRQRSIAQDALAHQAAHDSLTGLPNRSSAIGAIRSALLRLNHGAGLVGLLFVDLDGFKSVNDTLGHRVGDELLQAVAKRMQANVRVDDVVARFGGDEFVVLLEGLDSEQDAVWVAERLIGALSSPFTLSRAYPTKVGASVGIAFTRGDVRDPDVLLHEADLAVYRAKRAGRGRTEVFSPQLREHLASRTSFERDLRRAISNDELVLHYQPIVHTGTGEVHGYEALVRWQRPGLGLLSPAEFIPVAEESDLICELGNWVCHTATLQLAAWNVITGTTDLVMAVNISARHLARPRIATDIREALMASGVRASQMIIEVTETAVIDDAAGMFNLDELHELGIMIAIDDFGTGYSSIARLEHLPVDILKIDRHFLEPGNPKSEVLLRLMVDTAHALGLSTIAEGVEIEDQRRLLDQIGCEFGQGYLLGRPVPHPSVEPRINADRTLTRLGRGRSG